MKIVSGAAVQKGISLTSDVSDEVPTTLYGDPTRLRQILLNLLSNAIKFTESGSVKVSLRAEVETGASRIRVRFEVKDTGPGISSETQKQLFAPFIQADSSVTRKFGGTGLGLAICRRLVELMGGSIGVSSTPGEGSNFHFTVCLATSAVTKARAA